MRTILISITVLLLSSPARGFQYWNEIRHSALLPDSTVIVRVENPSGGGIENYLIYADGSMQEQLMTPVVDGPATLAAAVPGPVDALRRYGFRLIRDGELDLMPVRIGSGVVPQLSDLTRLAADAAGDGLFGYQNLDLVDCHVGCSDERLYAALRNVGGGFPVSSGLTFFGYLLAIADPADAEPDTVWAMMQTYTAAGIISPGLYRIEGSGMGDLVKIGDVAVQEFPESNTLMISCLLSDLLADPYLAAWYDPGDPSLGLAAFTQRITLLGGAAEADRSPGGTCWLRGVSIAPEENELPLIEQGDVVGSGAEAFARIEYTDANGHCPVLSEVFFDGVTAVPLYPVTLDYGSMVVYRSAPGVVPMSDGSWSVAVFRFSDDQTHVVEYEIGATDAGTEPFSGDEGLAVSNRPNPFNAATTISFDLPRPMHVTVSVYDAAGARVSRIAEADLPAGRHELRWDARGVSGAPLASGVYFIVVDAGGSQVVRKTVLLR